ncbi:MAG: glycosyl hydrolase family 18 protein [Clostridium sp.]
MNFSFKKKLLSTVAIATTVACTLSTSNVVLAQSANEKNNKSTEVSNKSTYRNVMYYGDWSVWGGQANYYPKYIPAENFTHLNYGFIDFNAKGELQFVDEHAAYYTPCGEDVAYGDLNAGAINAIQDLKLRNPNLKVGVSFGGWTRSRDFSSVCADPALRKKLAKNMVDFIKYTDMDLIDLDWEYPGLNRKPDLVDSVTDEGCIGTPEDKYNYTLLVKDIRAELDKLSLETGKTYEISIAMPSPPDMIEDSIDVKGMFEVIDFANLMTYDYRGPWDDKSGHTTGLYTNPKDPKKALNLSVDGSVKKFIELGAPSEKLVIGASYYTKGWEKVLKDGSDKNNPGLFGTCLPVRTDYDGLPTTGAQSEVAPDPQYGGRYSGVWRYGSIDKLKQAYPNVKEYWDDSAKAPYLYDENEGAFFTYDNVRSVEEKVKYVKENKLGGMMAWMASGDKQTDPSSKTRDELIKTTSNALYGNNLPKDNELKFTSLNIGLDISMNNYGNGSEISINLKNNSTLDSSNAVLKAAELRSKSILNGIVYIKLKNGTILSSAYPTSNITNKDGYTAIDLAQSNEGRGIKPGQSMNLKVYSDLPLKDKNDIQEIYITQRVYKDSVEFKKQVLHGNNDIVTLAEAAIRYNLKSSDSLFDKRYDLTNDGIIDIYDLVYIARTL